MLWFVLVRFPGALHLLQLCLAEHTKIVDQQICVIVSLSCCHEFWRLNGGVDVCCGSFCASLVVCVFAIVVLWFKFGLFVVRFVRFCCA